MTSINNFLYATNFCYNTYLSKIDLFQKYIIKNIFNLPFVQDIVFSLNLNFLNAFNKNNSTTSNHLLKLTFFYLICTFNKIPDVLSKASYSTIKSQKMLNTIPTLKIKINTRLQKYICFFFIFCEKWTYLKKYQFIQKTNKRLNKLTNKKQNALCLLYPFSALDNYELFYGFLNNLIISEDSYFNLFLNFRNLNPSNNIQCIKNLPFFWQNQIKNK